MKNIRIGSALLALFTLLFCFESCKDKCDKDVSIDAIQPNTNPAGYEVLIKTNDFTDAAKVVFGNIEADYRAGGKKGEIIATVPDGLSGNVEVSVEEGECIGRFDNFIVSGALPTDVQPSLPTIILPVPPSSFPTEGIQNNWVNAVADTTLLNFGIHLNGTFSGGVFFTSLDQSYEFSPNPIFDNLPATGWANTGTNTIYLEVDRTSIGGVIEHFDGLFVEPPSFLPSFAKWPILLTSRETGRQLLIYFPCFSGNC